MNMIKRSLSAGIGAAVVIISIAFAHTPRTNVGTLKVTVTDSATGTPLAGASVQLTETRQHAITKRGGMATIPNVRTGNYTVVAAAAGYVQQTIHTVRIDSATTTTIAVALARIPADEYRESEVVAAPPPGPAPDAAGGNSLVHSGRGAQGALGKKSGMGMYAPPAQTLSEVDLATTLSEPADAIVYGSSSNSEFNTAEYTHFKENEFKDVMQEPLSTFSIDVDGASYSNIRHFITSGQMPPKDLVRIEEMINYFRYDYPQPTGSDPFSITTELGPCPWKPTHQLVLVGLQGKEIPKAEAPPANLTFLLDVSGSMEPEERLPLLRKAFHLLVNEMRPQDRVAIVAYAGNAGLVLSPTTGEHKDLIYEALDRLEAGGSTAGGEGIELAYKIAKQNFKKEYNNRVILATDGDFNVGISNTGDLVRFIEEQRSSGIYLTTIGVGTDNYKDARMKELADKGNGNYYYLDNLLEAKKVFVTQMGGTLNTIAKDVKIQVEFNPAFVKGYRLIGYESRILAKEDFNNDKKDAGELGSGHTVTALYEVIPPGVDAEELHSVDSLRYQANPAPVVTAHTGEMMMVKFRYKRPEDSTSRLIEHPLEATSREIRIGNLAWATAVSEFGMLLRDSKFKAASSVADVLTRARTANGTDSEGYRAEFIKLVEMYQLLDKASK